MNKFFAIILFAAFYFAACGVKFKTVYYDSTLCEEVWHIEGANTATYISEAEKYLQENGIQYQGIDIVAGKDKVEGCITCECLTGSRLILDVENEYLEAIKALGFYQE